MEGFAPISGFGQQVTNEKATRFFRGDGTPYLALPGLRAGLNPDGSQAAIKEVRVGGMFLPPAQKREFPLDSQSTHPARAGLRSKIVDQPLYTMDYADNGVLVLIRNECSNDGVWQDGVVIAVTADWQEETPPLEPAKELVIQNAAAFPSARK